MIKIKALLVEVPWVNSNVGDFLNDHNDATFYLLSDSGSVGIPPDGTELDMELRKIGVPPNEILMGTSDGGATLYPILGCIREGVTVRILDPLGVLNR